MKALSTIFLLSMTFTLLCQEEFVKLQITDSYSTLEGWQIKADYPIEIEDLGLFPNNPEYETIILDSDEEINDRVVRTTVNGERTIKFYGGVNEYILLLKQPEFERGDRAYIIRGVNDMMVTVNDQYEFYPSRREIEINTYKYEVSKFDFFGKSNSEGKSRRANVVTQLVAFKKTEEGHRFQMSNEGFINIQGSRSYKEFYDGLVNKSSLRKKYKIKPTELYALIFNNDNIPISSKGIHLSYFKKKIIGGLKKESKVYLLSWEDYDISKFSISIQDEQEFLKIETPNKGSLYFSLNDINLTDDEVVELFEALKL